jgi:murein L,D-transpeptidase YafK
VARISPLHLATVKSTTCQPILVALVALLFAGSATTLAVPVSVAPASTAPAPGAAGFSNEVEASLVRAMETLREGGISAALREIDVLVEKNPNFQLGHLIKGDLLMAKAGSPLAFSGTKSQPHLMAGLRSEARARLARYFDGPPIGHLPTSLVQLSPNQKHVLLIDSDKARLYVFKNVDGLPQLVTDFYISTGKQGFEKKREGDKRTPVGVYQVTSVMAREKLPDFYGHGAFPINFPNEWDKRLGKTGSGIWIHGTPSTTYSRPPRDSDGCVVLTNEDFATISKYVNPGITPVVISPGVAWHSPDQWAKVRGDFTTVFKQWQKDWQSRDVEAYLRHYGTRFESEGKGLTVWSERKRRINSSKTYVKIDIGNFSAFEYALSARIAPMMMVTFDQYYKSNNATTTVKKRQYWQREDGQWKILYEAAVVT